MRDHASLAAACAASAGSAKTVAGGNAPNPLTTLHRPAAVPEPSILQGSELRLTLANPTCHREGALATAAIQSGLLRSLRPWIASSLKLLAMTEKS